jgi:hypothetical protein
MVENKDKQTVTVLTVYENDNSVPVIYFSCFNSLDDAHTHCKIINTLESKENEWVYARIINLSEKYQISKPIKYSFDIIKILCDEDINKITGYWCSKEGGDDDEFYFLFQSLKNTSDEILKRFFNDKYVNNINWETFDKKEYETFEDFKSTIESIIEVSSGLIKDAQDKILESIIELSKKGELLYPLNKIK